MDDKTILEEIWELYKVTLSELTTLKEQLFHLCKYFQGLFISVFNHEIRTITVNDDAENAMIFTSCLCLFG